jgi:GT2 family glycosyltransferase
LGETPYKLINSTLPSVSVVIPTCGTSLPVNDLPQYFLLELMKSVEFDMGDLLEVIIVFDAHTPQELLESLSALPKVILEPFNEPFNFSKKCNAGTRRASGDLILFLNDDMLARSSGWVNEIQMQFSSPDVGGVGGLLLTSEGLVQCAGHGNSPRPHIYGAGKDPNDPLFQSQLMTTREAGGLSGACFAVRRNEYLEIGGMCEDLPSSYNDVDLGFKLKTLGKKLMYVPSIQFLHYESISRDPKVTDKETALIWRRWGRYFDSDPYVQNL